MQFFSGCLQHYYLLRECQRYNFCSHLLLQSSNFIFSNSISEIFHISEDAFLIKFIVFPDVSYRFLVMQLWKLALSFWVSLLFFSFRIIIYPSSLILLSLIPLHKEKEIKKKKVRGALQISGVAYSHICSWHCFYLH